MYRSSCMCVPSNSDTSSKRKTKHLLHFSQYRSGQAANNQSQPTECGAVTKQMQQTKRERHSENTQRVFIE